MAGAAPRLLEAPPARVSGGGRTQPPAPAPQGPKATAPPSCQQQLSSRPKVHSRRGLAGWRWGRGSCQQHLSSRATHCLARFTRPAALSGPVLPTTTFWRCGPVSPITESGPCSPPSRSTNYIACIGRNAGRFARSNGTCVWAGAPSESIWRSQPRHRSRASAPASWIRSKPPSPNCWRRIPRRARPSSASVCCARL